MPADAIDPLLNIDIISQNLRQNNIPDHRIFFDFRLSAAPFYADSEGE